MVTTTNNSRPEETRHPPRHTVSGNKWLYPLLGVLLIALFAGSLTSGQENISLWRNWTQLIGGDENITHLIFWEIRLPRAILAVLVGGALGLSGAVLQGLLHNPLAEPGIVGISSCAALGAVVALYFGLSESFALALPLGGMAGAFIAVGTIYLLAGRGASALTVILAGVAVNSMAGALIALALNLAPSPFATVEIVFWMLGSLADRSFVEVRLALVPIVAGSLMLFSLGRPLDALTLGGDTATSLGFNIARVRFLAIFGTALAVGAAVAVSGTIGFVGLVVPHILRPVVGHQASRLLLPSALGGAILLLGADIMVRQLTQQTELRLGVLTALIGAPFFLSLVLQTRRSLT